MATTVKQLIGYLSTIKDQDQAVFYQYLLAKDTLYHSWEFERLVEACEDSSADNIANYMKDELASAEECLEEETNA